MKNSHEFIVTRDLYNEVEIEPNVFQVKLIRKNLNTKYFCRDISKISSYEQTYTEKGKIRRNYTKITVDGEGEKIIKMKYEDVKKLLEHRDNSLGYGKRH